MFQLRWLWQRLKGKRVRYIIALFISVFSSLMVLINPKIMQVITDNVIVGVKGANGIIVHQTKILIPLLVLMSIVTLGRTLMRYIMVIFFEQSSQAMIVNLRTKLYDNLQNQDMHFYDGYRTGDLMTRLTGDLDMVRNAAAATIFQITDSVTLFIAVLVYFLTVSWRMTLLLFALTPFIFAVTYIFSKKIRPLYIDLRERLSLLNTTAQEDISGNKVVKAFNREKFEIEKFSKKNDEFRKANLKASYMWLKFFPVIETLAQSLTVITILGGGIFIIRGELTYGELMAFSALSWAISNPMRMLGIILNDLQRFFASADKVIELYYAHPSIIDRHDAVEFKCKSKGKIDFENVTFKFGNETILDDINLEINPGETVGIMGATGSGKTTLINLIARFYDVTSGSVKVDDIDVRNIKLKSLRSSIGMATQEVFLFSDTVDGNIAYCDPDMPIEEVYEYAKVADADGFIQNMSEGYETVVGERGVGLSGGQKQRIALARALSVKPSILILDDTTSAVDMETEKYIQQKLSELEFSCTKIIIAQRISSVKNADKIIILNNKKIIEQGTHEELLAKHGYYYGINVLQQQGYDVLEEGENVGTQQI
jgi:ATP-binding cassette subfamily B multidrug efflux pump